MYIYMYSYKHTHIYIHHIHIRIYRPAAKGGLVPLVPTPPGGWWRCPQPADDQPTTPPLGTGLSYVRLCWCLMYSD